MNDAWIDCNGKIIEVRDSGHNDYASDLLEEEMGLEEMMDYLDEKNLSYPYEELHERGWVRLKVLSTGKIEILGGCIDLTKPMRNTLDPKMNTTQLRIAKKLCKESNTMFNTAINDRRFW